MLVDDHDVGAQALEAPVFLRLQDLAHQRHVASSPTTRTSRIGRSPEMACGHRPGWPSSFDAIVSALARSEPSVPSTREASRSNSTASSGEMPRWRSPLCACVSASAKVRGGARVVVLPRQRLGRLAIRGHAGRETEPHGGARRQPDPLAQADDRDRARRPSCPRARGRRAPPGWPGLRPRPRKRARSVSHSTGPCGRPSRLRAWNAHAAGSRWIARPPMAEQGGAVGQVLGFDEQLAERRVGEVVGRGREDDLGVAGHVELADARAVVADRDPPHLDVVFGRDRDVELCRQVLVAPPEARPVGGERDRVVVGLAPRRLIGRRPHGSRCARRAGR